MANRLETKELYAFLEMGARTAKIACVKKDGSPIVSPVWFVLDNRELVFTTMNTSLKYRLIQREPRVSVCVESDSYPYGFATIQGTATLHKLQPADLLKWTTQIASRYVPGELVEQFGRRNAVEDEVLVRVKVEKFFAFEGIAD
ncbi:PPOX class F420-dependent oxidoreductase [Halieaceae bacterium IMCC14734]|uniref:PPOX class F420-dependent oxidoreductase n=1 Tax=Candidatus Litorirhabdus singularis TaxID=2518993 RepID=A0ABT3TEM9_9GAMM|nr:PPOX class F420-dependent oxidoreductase [Candidatus Litorirhabdus singularis]MCX2980236.1 PPOX class F420-dependent oxidoreductase [Candidatus Litorirhabdus singularis]